MNYLSSTKQFLSSVVHAYTTRRTLSIFGVVLALAVPIGIVIARPVRGHRPSALVLSAQQPDTAFVYHDPGHHVGAYRMGVVGDDGALLLNCALVFDPQGLPVISDCELEPQASIGDVLNVLTRQGGADPEAVPAAPPAQPEVKEQ